MDKEQAILQRLEQLRQEQLHALKELKKVEKAKKKRRRRTTHGYPIERSSAQKKIQSHGEKRDKCVLGSTPGRENVTSEKREAGNNGSQIHERGKLNNLMVMSKRKSLKETGLNAMVKVPLSKQSIPDIDHQGDIASDKAEVETGNLKLDCQTIIPREETVSSTEKNVQRKVVASKVAEVLDCMPLEEDPVTRVKEMDISDVNGPCLTNPITHSKVTVISGTHNKKADMPLVFSDTCVSCPTASRVSRLTGSMTETQKTLIFDSYTSCPTASIAHSKVAVLSDTGAPPLTGFITLNKKADMPLVISDTCVSCPTASIAHSKVAVVSDTGASCLTGFITHNKKADMPLVISDTCVSCPTASGVSRLTGSMTETKKTLIFDSYTSCPTASIAHSKVTVIPDTGPSHLTGSLTDNKKTSLLATSVINHDDNGSCPSGSQPRENPSQTSPSQTKEDVHVLFRFPKPDDSILKTNRRTDFVLPDKDFAALKLEKLKQVRQLGLKEKCQKTDGKTDCQTDGKTDCQPDCSDGLMACTSNQNIRDDIKESGTTKERRNDQGVYDSLQNRRNDGMAKKHDENLESLCEVSRANTSPRNNASVDAQFQEIFSESLLEVLGGDQDFSYMQEMYGGGCTWLEGKMASDQHLSLHVGCENDLNRGRGDGSTLTLSNEVCKDQGRAIDENNSCRNVNDITLKQEDNEEGKLKVTHPVVSSSALVILCEFEDDHEDAMDGVGEMLGTYSDEKYVSEKINATEYHSNSKDNKLREAVGCGVGVERINDPASSLVESFDSLRSVREPCAASQATPPFPQEVSTEDISSSANDTPEISEFCFQHFNKLWSSNEVRVIKSLTLRNVESVSQIIAVCLPRFLVLWKSTAGSTWTVLQKWVLDEEEELFELEITSVDSCIVVLVGGTFSKGLGRVYCLLDRGDWNFDLCEEVSFSYISETVYEFKHMCLLPATTSAENLSVVLASINNGRILLTKWKIDLMCFCIENSEDFPELCGSDLSSLLTVDGTKCLLLGCIDYDIYLWNYNSCELVHKISLQYSASSRPVCLSAETLMGMFFLVLLYKEYKEIKVVAVNPQSGREACLKTLDMMAHMRTADPSERVLSCSKYGSYVVSSFTHGNVLLWNMASDETKLLNPFSDDVTCILLNVEESSISFGIASGSVRLNVIK